MGPGGPRGFGIVARRFLHKDEYIYELPGMIAKSSVPKIQSMLSKIIPHHVQNQGSEERVLFGPLRFVNHQCEGYNVSVSFTVDHLLHINITKYGTVGSPRQLLRVHDEGD